MESTYEWFMVLYWPLVPSSCVQRCYCILSWAFCVVRWHKVTLLENYFQVESVSFVVREYSYHVLSRWVIFRDYRLVTLVFGTVLHSNWKVSVYTYTLSSSSTMVDSRLCQKYSFAIDCCSLVLNDLDAVPPLDRRSLVRVSSCSSRSRGWVWFCDNSVVDFFVASRDSSVPATTSHVNLWNPVLHVHEPKILKRSFRIFFLSFRHLL